MGRLPWILGALLLSGAAARRAPPPDPRLSAPQPVESPSREIHPDAPVPGRTTAPPAQEPGTPASAKAGRRAALRVALHLRAAYRALCAEEFGRAQEVCEEVLLGAPEYQFARELRTLSQRFPQMTFCRRSLIAHLALWDSATDPDPADPLLPEGDAIRSLDPARAESLALLLETSALVRRPKGITGGDLLHEDYREEALLYRRLEEERFELDLGWTSFDDLLDLIRALTGLPLHHHRPEDSEDPAERPLRVAPTSLQDGLEAALGAFGHRLAVRSGTLLVLPDRK